MWGLIFYHLAFFTYLPLYDSIKFIFFSTPIIYVIYMHQLKSEALNNCHYVLRDALYGSRWYLCAPSLRRDICQLLQNWQQLRHLILMKGTMILSFGFLMKTCRAGFSFVNFMSVRVKNKKR